jgi:pimeloyl-ACP methyl ester carboxylesterase
MMRRRYWLLAALAAVVGGSLAWAIWSERNPERERDLRIHVQAQLETWFPEGMQLPDELVGFIPRSAHFDTDQLPDVILVHGLDEPGGIWDELVPALDDVGINAWEFRYPNDQAIDHSADLLAESWPNLAAGPDPVLIGHSMGGLVIRDFVSRWRHPVDQHTQLEGPAVKGLILVATPNQGSEWARLRVWLELREFASDITEQRFSPFAGLRDGTGAAKIDLRPGSRFLVELNQRSWPEAVPIRLIGGVLTEPDEILLKRFEGLADDLDAPELGKNLAQWWTQAGEGIGDGAVPISALELDDAPQALILEASHRGLLVSLPLSDDKPPAIEVIVELLNQWLGNPAQPDAELMP